MYFSVDYGIHELMAAIQEGNQWYQPWALKSPNQVDLSVESMKQPMPLNFFLPSLERQLLVLRLSWLLEKS